MTEFPPSEARRRRPPLGSISRTKTVAGINSVLPENSTMRIPDWAISTARLSFGVF